MEETERVKKQKELIEFLGRQNEKEGYLPVTARILCLSMVMDKKSIRSTELLRK